MVDKAQKQLCLDNFSFKFIIITSLVSGIPPMSTMTPHSCYKIATHTTSSSRKF